MPTGLRVINDFGTVQIDENYFNLVLLDKRVASVEMPTGPGVYEHVFPGDVIVCGVKCFPETFQVLGCKFDGVNWTYRFIFFNNPDTTGTAIFTIYTFGRPPAPAQNLGLEVFDGIGRRVFHSQFKPLKIVASVFGTSAYTDPAGALVAAVVEKVPLYGYSIFPAFVTDTWGIRCNGNYTEVQRGSIASGGAGLSRDGSYSVIDVTNY